MGKGTGRGEGGGRKKKHKKRLGSLAAWEGLAFLCTYCYCRYRGQVRKGGGGKKCAMRKLTRTEVRERLLGSNHPPENDEDNERRRLWGGASGVWPESATCCLPSTKIC